MTFFAFCIYIGGIVAMWDQKIGFFNRVFWPFSLGEWLHYEMRKRGFPE